MMLCTQLCEFCSFFVRVFVWIPEGQTDGLKYLNGGILDCQIAAKPCSGQFWNVVDNNHPIWYNNAGLSSAPFHRKLEADHP